MGKGKKRELPPRPTVESEGIAQSGILAFCRQFQHYDAAHLLEVWSSTDSDGYGLARALEAYGLHPTEETVMELSQLESHIQDALVVAEKNWVRENAIQLCLPVGQQVIFPVLRDEAAGVIIGIDAPRAQYYIRRDNDAIPERTYVVRHELVKVLSASCSSQESSWPCPTCGLGPCVTQGA